MSNDERDLLAVAGAMLLIPAIIVGSCIWSGYALALAWRWIMVPTFEVPALTIPQAIGVTMIAAHLSKTVCESKEKTDWTKLFAKLAGGPAFFLLGTYIVSLFL